MYKINLKYILILPFVFLLTSCFDGSGVIGSQFYLDKDSNAELIKIFKQKYSISSDSKIQIVFYDIPQKKIRIIFNGSMSTSINGKYEVITRNSIKIEKTTEGQIIAETIKITIEDKIFYFQHEKDNILIYILVKPEYIK